MPYLGSKNGSFHPNSALVLHNTSVDEKENDGPPKESLYHKVMAILLKRPPVIFLPLNMKFTKSTLLGYFAKHVLPKALIQDWMEKVQGPHG